MSSYNIEPKIIAQNHSLVWVTCVYPSAEMSAIRRVPATIHSSATDMIRQITLGLCNSFCCGYILNTEGPLLIPPENNLSSNIRW
jgi:hypothetical protein